MANSSKGAVLFFKMAEQRRQATLLPEIYEIERNTELDIHAIYVDKRRKGWSPTAACLMSSIKTGVPECFVQQLIRYKLKSQDGGGAPFSVFVNPENGYPYGTFYCENRLEMVKYFKQVNAERRSPWKFDEINHQNKLAKELNLKVCA